MIVRSAFVGLVLATIALASTAARTSPSTADGIYSPAQSARGAVVYGQRCAGCHGAQLIGGSAPPLKGPFWSSWKGRSMGELYQFTQGSMPLDAPSSLSDADYAAVIAHMLKAGGYPAGAKPLPAASAPLSAIKIGSPK